jgi:hypothetical protein
MNGRIRPVEDRTYELRNVYLTQFILAEDGDIHMVVRDGTGTSMIAEIPNPRCVSSASRWKAAIRSARVSFTRTYHLTHYFQNTRRLIDLRGLGFFDEVKGQAGVAPNGIELHPVIWIRFGP